MRGVVVCVCERAAEARGVEWFVVCGLESVEEGREWRGAEVSGETPVDTPLLARG